MASEEYPACPHGCGRLTNGGGVDFYICMSCGDEWDTHGWDDAGDEVVTEPMPATSGGVAFIDRSDP